MDDLFSGLDWYVVSCHQFRIEKAHERLTDQGYQSFLPMRHKVISHAKQKRVVSRPVFERYLFVGVRKDQPLYPIYSTRGVSSVLSGADNKPTKVPLSVLRSIKERCEAPVQETPVLQDLQIGQSVRVLDGAFQDFLAIFSGYEGKFAKILLDLFGAPRIVNISPHALEVDDPPKGAAAILKAA